MIAKCRTDLNFRWFNPFLPIGKPPVGPTGVTATGNPEPKVMISTCLRQFTSCALTMMRNNHAFPDHPSSPSSFSLKETLFHV